MAGISRPYLNIHLETWRAIAFGVRNIESGVNWYEDVSRLWTAARRNVQESCLSS